MDGLVATNEARHPDHGKQGGALIVIIVS